MFSKIFTFGKILNIDVKEGRLKGKYVSVVKEYDNQENLLYITQPRISNLFVPLGINDYCKIRYLEGTVICGFNSCILDIYNEIDPVIFKMAGPIEIERNERRKFMRVPTPNIKTTFFSEYLPNQSEIGFLGDISLGGLCFETSRPMAVDEPLRMNFELPMQSGGLINISDLSVKILWAKVLNGRNFCGAGIKQFKQRQETSLNKYIVEVQRANNWEQHVQKVAGSLIE